MKLLILSDLKQTLNIYKPSEIALVNQVSTFWIETIPPTSGPHSLLVYATTASQCCLHPSSRFHSVPLSTESPTLSALSSSTTAQSVYFLGQSTTACPGKTNSRQSRCCSDSQNSMTIIIINIIIITGRSSRITNLIIWIKKGKRCLMDR